MVMALAATLGATAAPVAQGAWSCRVGNATQGTAAVLEQREHDHAL